MSLRDALGMCNASAKAVAASAEDRPGGNGGIALAMRRTVNEEKTRREKTIHL